LKKINVAITSGCTMKKRQAADFGLYFYVWFQLGKYLSRA
jgi:hypothetical protein